MSTRCYKCGSLMDESLDCPDPSCDASAERRAVITTSFICPRCGNGVFRNASTGKCHCFNGHEYNEASAGAGPAEARCTCDEPLQLDDPDCPKHHPRQPAPNREANVTTTFDRGMTVTSAPSGAFAVPISAAPLHPAPPRAQPSAVPSLPTRSELPTLAPATLLKAFQEADVTTRHLEWLHRTKHKLREAGKMPEHGSMVEAILLWWESGVRAEVFDYPAALASRDAGQPLSKIETPRLLTELFVRGLLTAHDVERLESGKLGAGHAEEPITDRNDPRLREPLKWDELESIKWGGFERPLSHELRHRLCNMAQESARQLDGSAEPPEDTALLDELDRHTPFKALGYNQSHGWELDTRGSNVRAAIDAARSAAPGTESSGQPHSSTTN